MKEERLAILGMLEKGIITVDEAERLLNTLQKDSIIDTEGIGATVSGALEKAGQALGVVAKKAGETAERMQPRVKSAAFRVKEKTYEWKDDAAYYKERLKQKRAQAKQEAEENEDPYDFSSIAQACEEETSQPAAPAEEIDPEMEKYAQKIDGVMDSIQEQVSQIDSAEDFLRNAFGDIDYNELEDDDDDAQAEGDSKEETK